MTDHRLTRAGSGEARLTSEARPQPAATPQSPPILASTMPRPETASNVASFARSLCESNLVGALVPDIAYVHDDDSPNYDADSTIAESPRTKLLRFFHNATRASPSRPVVRLVAGLMWVRDRIASLARPFAATAAVASDRDRGVFGAVGISTSAAGAGRTRRMTCQARVPSWRSCRSQVVRPES